MFCDSVKEIQTGEYETGVEVQPVTGFCSILFVYGLFLTPLEEGLEGVFGGYGNKQDIYFLFLSNIIRSKTRER